MTDTLAELNPAQREAVSAPDGPVLVVAGAGSGKTRVLTTRIAWLLQERRLSPAAVLAFTFTNRAARQMRERVDRLVGEGRAPGWIGTFHATGVRILRRDGGLLGLASAFSIYDTDDTLRLIKQVMGQLGLDTKQIAPNAARTLISKWKNDDCSPRQAQSRAAGYVETRVADIYTGYEDGLRACQAVDFDDLILRTVHLLERHEEVRQKYASRFRHVLVDEFQDTNPLQLVLVKALASHHGNLFVVGDDDQSIYSWRGACIENMLRFEDYFPGTCLLRLEQNYRSTGNILAAANAVIAHNRRRKGKNLWTSGEAGDLLHIERLSDAEDEAARLVEIVAAATARGLSRQDVTVLYRTNAQSRVLEGALRRSRLPYQIVGSLQFYERREVRDVLAYLKLVANPRDQISALRVINTPRRKIGVATVGQLVASARAAGLTLGETAAQPGLLEQVLGAAACQRVRDYFAQVTRWRDAAATTAVPALLERIISEVGYGTYLEADEPDTARARNENVAELINAAAAFDEATDGGSLALFLEQVALVSDVDGLDEGEGCIRLMTIHTAKGLEFPVVVVVGCEEDLLPHISSLDDQSSREEERRLFYVALTRARQRVFLLHAGRRRRFGVYEDCQPSRYLTEIPSELVELHVDLATIGYRPGPARGRPALGSPLTAAAGRQRRPQLPRTTASLWADEISQVEVQFREGQAVRHARFGQGVVARVEGSGESLLVTVDFPAVGRKHLLARHAQLIPLE